MTRRATTALSVLGLLGALLAGPATAVDLHADLTPGSVLVCTGDVPKELCGGRTVPEPRQAAGYLTRRAFEAAALDLAEEFPGVVTLASIGDSPEGRPLWELEVTDPDSPVPYEEREVVYLAQSIHGDEVGGREGAIRVAEDLARSFAAGDPQAATWLANLRLVQVMPNPDGWARGDWDDLDAQPIYRRGNSSGVDLNRLFPWPGHIPGNRTPLSQDEARHVADDAAERRDRGERVVATADVHGMVQDSAAVWTMLSSGQFDLHGVARQVAIGETITAEVEDTIGDHALFVLGEAAGDVVVPHLLTTSSEFKGGLSGSGFLGDWLAQEGGLDAPSVSTIELFYNQPVHAFSYASEIVQIHVDSVREIIRAMLDMALVDHDVALVTDGPVGYLGDDGLAVAAPDGATPVPGASMVADPMRFFDDLGPFVPAGLERVDAEELTGDRLADLVALVVSSQALADAGVGAHEAVRAYLDAGGTVVLTDAGLTALPALAEGLSDEDVARATTSIGNAAFVDHAHPLAAGVRPGALHTYEPSTLGYNTGGASQAPVWRVARDAFEAVGGATVATTGGQAAIGELAVGGGVIRVIGGLVPPAREGASAPFGLSSYAPTDTGYQVLANALGAELTVTPVPVRAGATTAAPTG